jgi:hypothetical protein
LKYRISFFFHIDDLSLNGIPSQSSDYYWVAGKVYMTADLAISGTPYDTFAEVACAITLAIPKQTVAWWMLTFPVDTVFITNVKINYRSIGKSSCQLIWLL